MFHMNITISIGSCWAQPCQGLSMIFSFGLAAEEKMRSPRLLIRDVMGGIAPWSLLGHPLTGLSHRGDLFSACSMDED